MKVLRNLLFIASFILLSLEGIAQDTSWYKVKETFSSYKEHDYHNFYYEKMDVDIYYETIYVKDLPSNEFVQIGPTAKAHYFLYASNGYLIEDKDSAYSIGNPVKDSVIVYTFELDSMQGIAYFHRYNFKGISRKDIGTGITQPIIDKEGLEMFPNPVSDRINIKGLESNFQYNIYDLKGELISKGENSNSSIYTGYLPTGTYLINIKVGEKYFTNKFIKL